MTSTRIHAAVLLLALVAPPASAGVGECDTQTRSDFENFDSGPDDGLLISTAAKGMAGEDQTTISSGLTMITRRSDHELTVTARVDVLDGRVKAAAYIFGYAEAGTELTLVVADPHSWGLVCEDAVELEVASYMDIENVSPRSVELSCSWSQGYAPSAEEVLVYVGAHTWAGAGFGEASAELVAQVVDVSLEGCSSGSCAGECGGSPDGNCFCDEACTFYGDCCGDYGTQCERDSCWESCGQVSVDLSCFCDEACVDMGDCCDDNRDACL